MAILGDLTDDVLRDILSRIPAKPVCRSKLVCKLWLAIIENNHFIRLHHSRAGAQYCVRVLQSQPETQNFMASMMALFPSGNSYLNRQTYLSSTHRSQLLPYDYSSKLYQIVSLNTKDVLFKTIPLPPDITCDSSSIAVCAVTKYKNHTESRFDVWIMRDDNRVHGYSWSKKYTIDLAETMGSIPDSIPAQDENGVGTNIKEGFFVEVCDLKT